MTSPYERLRAEAAALPNDAAALPFIERLEAEVLAAKTAKWQPYPWQHPHRHPEDGQHKDECPPGCRNPHLRSCDEACRETPEATIGTHGMWLQLGGRGTGKTEGAARYVNDHMAGDSCDPRLPGRHRVLIVAPTQGDGVESCVRGPSGLMVINPTVRLVGGTGGLAVRWPSKARARILGAYTPEDVERLRSAGNTCLVWLEETAAMRQLAAALTHTSMGLRIGSSPHYVASTTPKPRQELRDLLAKPGTVVTKGRTADAHHLDPTVRDSYFDQYDGTRVGRQELDADLLDDVEGALWTLALIDAHRHKGPLPVMDEIVVGVDPPGGGRAEAGIVVVGRCDRDGYVLADLSGRYTPDEWGQVAVAAYHRFNATKIVAETTYGGAMVVSTLRTVDDTVPIHRAPTKVGKRLRAEPVVALYEQGRMHHVGALAALETQQTEWVPGEGDSPDRVDALVHAGTYLLVTGGRASVSSAVGQRVPTRIPRRA